MKDFKDIIRETEPEGCYRLKMHEAAELLQLAQEDNIKAIMDTFSYGFYQGMRYERNRQKREARQRKA
jgi:hypothetical protein